jgi:hypothetical protein
LSQIEEVQLLMSELGVGVDADAHDRTFEAPARFWSFDMPFASDVLNADGRAQYIYERFEFYGRVREAMVVLVDSIHVALQIVSHTETFMNHGSDDTATEAIKIRFLALALLRYIDINYTRLASWLGEPVENADEVRAIVGDR